MQQDSAAFLHIGQVRRLLLTMTPARVTGEGVQDGEKHSTDNNNISMSAFRRAEESVLARTPLPERAQAKAQARPAP